MMKTDYQTPRSRILDMDLEGALLVGSVSGAQTLNPVDGMWDEEED